jgi:hypothetical protein
MVQKGILVTNYQAKRRVRFVCGLTGNALCANKTLYGEPVTSNTLDYIPSAGFTGYWNGSGLYS